jgi:hypothetical protein
MVKKKLFTDQLEASKEYTRTIVKFASGNCTDSEVAALATHAAARVMFVVIEQESSPEELRRFREKLRRLELIIDKAVNEEKAADMARRN